jgi:hypothetical protein
MTSQSPRIYTYKITFEEVPYYYYGVHKEKRFDEYYVGSPKTNKWCWELYTPKKQILQFFDFTDEGWLEAQEIETRLIRPFLNHKWCLNERCGGLLSLKVASEAGKKGAAKNKENKVGIFSMTKEEQVLAGKNSYESRVKNGTDIFSKLTTDDRKKIGKENYKNKIGIHGRTNEQMKEDGRKAGLKVKELGVGIFAMTDEERKIASKKANETNKKNGTGIYSFSPKQRKENSSRGGIVAGKRCKELGIGVCGIPIEKRRETGRKTCSQKWMCIETGFITNPGNLTKYQNKRGIDTSKRVRIS